MKNSIEYAQAVQISSSEYLNVGDVVYVEKRHKQNIKNIERKAKQLFKSLKGETESTKAKMIAELLKTDALIKYYYVGTYNNEKRFTNDKHEVKKLAANDGKVTKILNKYPINYLGGQVLSRYIVAESLKRNGIDGVKSNYSKTIVYGI